MNSATNDVHEKVRQFNEDEAAWRCFVRKRARRKRLYRLLQSLDSTPRLTEDELDRLDWFAAERETRVTHAIGQWFEP